MLTLARLEAGVGLVDDVDAAFPAHDPAILVPLLGGFERIHNLHGLRASEKRRREGRPRVSKQHWEGRDHTDEGGGCQPTPAQGGLSVGMIRSDCSGQVGSAQGWWQS